MSTGTHTIRVRYGESDQMGVAHHASYITWFEECRIELLRSLGASYRELEASGVLMPVIEINVRYRRSLRFDDLATCETTAEAKGPSRVVFRTVVKHGEIVCADAEVTVASVDRSGRPVRIPPEVLARLA
ncbi:MAG TPA: thioesterase family protein [Planctomycetota bacterium]|nr:thioesterase family protein [Planctomycetota bacterium]